MTDMFDLTTAQIVNAPDVRTWPITTAITQVIFDGTTTRVVFDKQDGPDRWPDVTPAGWSGPLQYTLWLFRQLNGVWVGSAFVQFWHGRAASGDPRDPDVPSRYRANWFYAARWTPIFGSGLIVPGERIGFLVTSGNGRDSVGPFSVRERSNVVVFPASDDAVFTFAADQTPPAPAPPDTPPSAPGVPAGADPYMARFDRLEAMLRSLVGTFDPSSNTIRYRVDPP